VGNVWEWCLNKDGRPEQVAADTSGDERALRGGGSWIDSLVFALGSQSFRSGPDARVDNIGVSLGFAGPIA
jgi:formylglycine-generating enzyme required for sulfatase activity